VDEWYYSTDGKQSLGPVSAEELGRILAAQGGAENVLAWRPGMANWAGAASVPELKSYLQPPPRPPEIALLDPTPVDHERKRESSAVHPWRRYFARIFDLYLFALVFFFALGLLAADWFSGPPSRSSDLLLSFVSVATYSIFETFCLFVFGGTLGKLLYGIRLAPKSGGRIGLRLALKRSVAVWVQGMGIGIPIIALVTFVLAYRTLRREGQTNWDRDLKFVVLHRKLSYLRWFVVALVWFLILSTYAGLMALSVMQN